MTSNNCWQPAVTKQRLRMRAELLSTIRNFFAEICVLEVITPSLSLSAATDVMLDSFSVYSKHSSEFKGYLHTSPELFMKRLLASHSGAIYQICSVFRDGEVGRYHNPEFQMLEWYRPGYAMADLIEEVATLVSRTLQRAGVDYQVIRYLDLFQSVTGMRALEVPVQALIEWAMGNGVQIDPETAGYDRDTWLQLIMTHVIEPGFDDQKLTFVSHFPSTQAALAKLDPGDPSVALRFELYLGGMELANGFEELTCPMEQRARFEADLCQRERLGCPTVPMDVNFLAALESGMPECSGVALGLDRLLMIQTGAAHINEVIAFPYDRI